MRFRPALALLLLAMLSQSGAAPTFSHQLRWKPVPLDRSQTGRKRVGALTYLGGWALESSDPRFGGISGMTVQGRDVLAISDQGSLIRFRVPQGAVSISELPAGPGKRARKATRDAESMVVAGGRAWIGFERVNQIWSYALPNFRPLSSASPQPMRSWETNTGAEGIVRLRSGRFLVFSEGKPPGRPTSEVLLFDGDPSRPSTRVTRLFCRVERGYSVSDAALLPDGRVLMLQRRYSPLEGVSVKLVRATLPPWKTDAVIEGQVIADFRAPLTVDNFEALAVTQESGRPIVWIASDDNFNPLQRTLLMKFALDR